MAPRAGRRILLPARRGLPQLQGQPAHQGRGHLGQAPRGLGAPQHPAPVLSPAKHCLGGRGRHLYRCAPPSMAPGREPGAYRREAGSGTACRHHGLTGWLAPLAGNRTKCGMSRGLMPTKVARVDRRIDWFTACVFCGQVGASHTSACIMDGSLLSAPPPPLSYPSPRPAGRSSWCA